MKINKKITISALLVCVFATGYAQKQKKAAISAECQTCAAHQAGITVLNYVTNQQKQYVVTGCVPGSDVELYATPSGGWVVATETADEKGAAHFSVSPETPVAFALNHNRVSANGVAGNGHIIQIPQPALNLDGFELSNFAGDVVLRWKASITAGDWAFVVQRSNDNVTFTDVAKLTAKESAGELLYDYTCPKEQGAAQYYRIEARDISGARVALEAISAKNKVKAQFQVQPTVFSNTLQITMPQDKLPATYVISDLAGRAKYVTGRINVSRQSIQVALAAAGTYVLQVTDNKGLSSSQMIIKK